MATVSITERPIVTVNDSPVIKSRWVAGWNPIRYQFTFTGITDPTTYLIVSVYEYGSNIILGKESYRPRNGVLNIDIAGITKSYLYSLYAPDFDGELNCKDTGNSIKVYITYQLCTLTEDGVTASDESNYLYVVNSVKQIQEVYGQNMAEYVPYGVEGIIKAKFLTKFEEPVYFSGYPFSLSFIFSENIIGHELKLLEERLDLNRQFINDLETDLDPSEGHYVNHLKVQDSYSNNVNYIDISISTGDVVPELYVYAGYVETGYTEAR
jgi:hypothetical protein